MTAPPQQQRYRHYPSGSEQQHYDKDVTFTTRNQAGTEKWIFTITDKDGNIAQEQFVLTVQ